MINIPVSGANACRGCVCETLHTHGSGGGGNSLSGSLQVDIAHAKAILAWNPVVGMQQAVNNTTAYFMAHR